MRPAAAGILAAVSCGRGAPPSWLKSAGSIAPELTSLVLGPRAFPCHAKVSLLGRLLVATIVRNP